MIAHHGQKIVSWEDGIEEIIRAWYILKSIPFMELKNIQF
jgi:hypothetical protein